MTGTVKTANSRGYGFISTASGIDYYFHYSQYKDDWKKLLLRVANEDKTEVKFDNDPSATDGPRAINVVPTNV